MIVSSGRRTLGCVDDDTLDDGQVLRCDDCGVLMRDIPGGWECPACGSVVAPVVKVRIPPKFYGPTLYDGPPEPRS